MYPTAPSFARVFALALIALGFNHASALRAEPPTNDDLAGSTWELVSYKYGDAIEWENAPGSERKLKMLTSTHFIWVMYETANGELKGSGGGTYSLTGAVYTEVVEFGLDDVASLRGPKQVFTLDLRGDRLEQTGQLSTGFKIAEIWQRVRG